MGGILGSIVGAVLDAIAKAITGFLQSQQQRADTIELGQQRQMTADAVNVITVQNKMAEEAAKPHDLAVTREALNNGTF